MGDDCPRFADSPADVAAISKPRFANVLRCPTLEGTGMVPGSGCPRCTEKWPLGPGSAAFVGRNLAVRGRRDVAVREFEMCGLI